MPRVINHKEFMSSGKILNFCGRRPGVPGRTGTVPSAAITRGRERRMVFQLSVELGAHHAVQDDWNTVTVTRRDGTWRLRGCANHASSAGNYPTSDRCNQTVDRDGRATLFQIR